MRAFPTRPDGSPLEQGDQFQDPATGVASVYDEGVRERRVWFERVRRARTIDASISSTAAGLSALREDVERLKRLEVELFAEVAAWAGPPAVPSNTELLDDWATASGDEKRAAVCRWHDNAMCDRENLTARWMRTQRTLGQALLDEAANAEDLKALEREKKSLKDVFDAIAKSDEQKAIAERDAVR